METREKHTAALDDYSLQTANSELPLLEVIVLPMAGKHQTLLFIIGVNFLVIQRTEMSKMVMGAYDLQCFGGIIQFGDDTTYQFIY